MTLFRVDDGEDKSRIMWNYYPDTELLAYSLGGRYGRSHGPIQRRVEETYIRQGKPIGGDIRTMTVNGISI